MHLLFVINDLKLMHGMSKSFFNQQFLSFLKFTSGCILIRLPAIQSEIRCMNILKRITNDPCLLGGNMLKSNVEI